MVVWPRIAAQLKEVIMRYVVVKICATVRVAMAWQS